MKKARIQEVSVLFFAVLVGSFAMAYGGSSGGTGGAGGGIGGDTGGADDALLCSDGTGGATLGVCTVGNLDNIRIDGNTISTTNSNGDLVLAPNGSGNVVVPQGADGLSFGSGGASISDSSSDGRLDFEAGGSSRMDLVDVGGGNYRLRVTGTGGISGGNFLLNNSILLNGDTSWSRLAAAVWGSNGSIGLADPGAKPTCDASHRFWLWPDAGGAGVADTFEVCVKDAGDSYAWVSLIP